MKLSQDFWEKAVLLLLTAVITGFLAPVVLKGIEETRAVEQKRNEAELSRQSKIIEAQSKLLEELIETLWKWRYVSMKVAYSGDPDQKDQYVAAVKEYQISIWDQLNKFRNLTSKARWLISERGYAELLRLYDRIADYDGRLDQIIRTNSSPAERAAALAPMHKELREALTSEIDAALDMIARETQLKARVSPIRVDPQ